MTMPVQRHWRPRPCPATMGHLAARQLDLRNLLAISRYELLATDIQGGLWHFQGESWTRDSIDPSHPQAEVHALTLAPDGTAWAAGSDGVAYRRDGRWTIADAAEASVITVGRDGEIGGSKLTSPSIIGTTPTGDVWVADDPSAIGPEEPGLIRARPLRRNGLDRGGAA